MSVAKNGLLQKHSFMIRVSSTLLLAFEKFLIKSAGKL